MLKKEIAYQTRIKMLKQEIARSKYILKGKKYVEMKKKENNNTEIKINKQPKKLGEIYLP